MVDTLISDYSNFGINLEHVYDRIFSFCPNLEKDLNSCLNLRNFIYHACSDERIFTTEGAKEVISSYFNKNIPNAQDNIIQPFHVEVIFKAAIVYCLSLRQEYVFDKFNTVEELLSDYPSFSDCEDFDSLELEYLVEFRNMMKVALDIIPGRCNKRLLLSICTILEGSGRSYATGGTQSLATSRRVLIYEQESGIKPRKRIPRSLQSLKQGNPSSSPRPPLMICCPCGATILKRTMWKHKKSKKHLSYCQSISIPTPELK